MIKVEIYPGAKILVSSQARDRITKACLTCRAIVARAERRAKSGGRDRGGDGGGGGRGGLR